jgi:hypothetical protein
MTDDKKILIEFYVYRNVQILVSKTNPNRVFNVCQGFNDCYKTKNNLSLSKNHVAIVIITIIR